MTIELDRQFQKVEENNLDMMGLIDSEDTMKTYLRLNMLWGKELAVELTRIIKSIRYLRKNLEKISEEIGQLKAQINRPKRGLAYD